MENPKNIVQPNAVGPTKAKDVYYQKGKYRKLGDFLIGFFGAIGLMMIPMFMQSSVPSISGVLLMLFFVALFPIGIFCSKNGRRFITIGMISISIIPLLLAGSCFVLLGLNPST
jgi:hypothetical protein